jgi:DNA replication protein DnaC
MNNNATLEKIRDLKLHGMYRSFQTALELQSHQSLTADELISMLVEAEYNYRRNLKVKTNIHRARFRYSASVENVNYSTPRGLDKNLFMRLCEGSFIERSENVIITGPAGVGKSWLATALGHHACMMGKKVRYFDVSKLFTALKMSKADQSYLKETSRLEKQDLLILDDFGLHPIEPAIRLTLLDIMEDRHGKGSTIFVSQIPVNKWHELLGEKTVADAILDRVVHCSHRIELKGESLRNQALLTVKK